MLGRTKATRHTPLAAFPKHALVIADIVASWNTIEDACSVFLPLFTMVATDQADVMLAHIASPQARLDFIAAAGRYALAGNATALATLNLIFEDLSKRLAVRNRYAHGLYVTNDKGELCIRRRRYESDHSKNQAVLHLNGLKQEMAQSLSLLKRVHDFLLYLEAQIPPELNQALHEIHGKRFPLRQTNRA